jgi:hypothetical protein
MRWFGGATVRASFIILGRRRLQPLLSTRGERCKRRLARVPKRLRSGPSRAFRLTVDVRPVRYPRAVPPSRTRRAPRPESAPVDAPSQPQVGFTPECASTFDYDVAISFAGCDRAKARVIAALLDSAGIRVFYDEFEKAKLWGLHGTAEFYGVYAERARFAVVLVSDAYSHREWTRHELRSVRDRALRERGAYLLPVRTEPAAWLDGVPRDVIYLDWASDGPLVIASAVARKLGRPPVPTTQLSPAALEALDRVDVRELLFASGRIRNALERRGTRSLSDLLRLTRADLLSTHNLGQKSVSDIEAALQRLGLRLGMASPRRLR